MTLCRTSKPVGLRRDTFGGTITEFGFVAPLLCAFILGFLDFAHWAYIRVISVGALEEAARSAGVGGAAVDPRVFETKVERIVRHASKQARFTWEKKSYYQFSGIGKPEKLTSDINGNKKYDAGDCWEDLNPNNVYDTNPGRSGIGGADDIVYYQVRVTYDPIVPISGLLPGVPRDRTTTVNTIVKRQPFAAQTVPAIKC